MGSFEEIYNTYFRDVFRYVRSLSGSEAVAEEVTEETFLRAMVSLGSFRGDCDIRVWLFRIAKNCWLTEKKKQSRLVPENSLPERVAEDDVEQALADKESALAIHRVLHDIEEPYKEVFSLRVFGELSFRQIGEIFGKSEHWACVTYHRAKEKIRKEMGLK